MNINKNEGNFFIGQEGHKLLIVGFDKQTSKITALGGRCKVRDFKRKVK
jgi:hypothetical protein